VRRTADGEVHEYAHELVRWLVLRTPW
jgi:hypothetical protein